MPRNLAGTGLIRPGDIIRGLSEALQFIVYLVQQDVSLQVGQLVADLPELGVGYPRQLLFDLLDLSVNLLGPRLTLAGLGLLCRLDGFTRLILLILLVHGLISLGLLWHVSSLLTVVSAFPPALCTPTGASGMKTALLGEASTTFFGCGENYMTGYWKKLKYARRQESGSGQNEEAAQSTPLSPCLEDNLTALTKFVNNSSDMVTRRFRCGSLRQANAAAVYVNGLTDTAAVSVSILQPLMYDAGNRQNQDAAFLPDIAWMQENLLAAVNAVQRVSSLEETADALVGGATILFLDSSPEALLIDARKWEGRGIEEPKTENVVRGPKEGFTESFKVNTTLIRRKLKTPDLCIESITLGKKTRTEVVMLYLRSVAKPQLVVEVRRRLQSIRTDAILESGYIEAFIEDAPYSIFSTVANSEKPDIVAAKLLEGRVAVIVDGTPFVLTVPMLFLESFQSPEDYYSRPYYTSLIRSLRFLAWFISILAPAIYVALSTFHQELIPTELLIAMAAGHEGVPFPALVEALMMIIVFEILREAGVRLPRAVGSAISIVGALVIGETAVSAGLIGPIMVIVVSLTAIASFIVPPQTDSGSLLRILFLLAAGAAGGFGILIGLLVLLIHLASLRSFGAPYLAPMAPLSVSGLKDTFFRVPLWAMVNRPRGMAREPQRVPAGQKPTIPGDARRTE